jgi:molybdopterin molybdotransferase
MPEFLTLLPPAEALKRFIEKIAPLADLEMMPTAESLGRVVWEKYTAPHDLPAFARTTVDGYAVCARDTHGASESLPAYLKLIGEVPMGAASANLSLSQGECALIHTGGMLPPGADCAVMLEHTQQTSAGEIEVFRSLATGENTIKIGEAVRAGTELFSPGKRLRASELGGLMALGITELQVYRKPQVAILSSGDEVIPPDWPLAPGKVRDVNAYTLSALVESAGGDAKLFGISRDDEDDLYQKARAGLDNCDMLVITAGSSASTRDLTATVINRLGSPGVIVHGVNVRPGKPTILGMCDSRPVVGLPGNPVSALVIARLFVAPVVERLGGANEPALHPTISARLMVNLSSQAGREDWVPVRLVETPEGYRAEPIFGKSNLIFTLIHANGLIRIDEDANGLAAGTMVQVHLL